MVDTRDFVVILSLALNEMRIALVTYSTLFLLALCGQIVIFIRKYARPAIGNSASPRWRVVLNKP
jgi:hypothetical protein